MHGNEIIYALICINNHFYHVNLACYQEAVSNAVYLLNIAPTRSLEKSTPYEKWTGHKPNLSYFKTFGCLAHVLMQDGHRTKLEDQSRPMIFIGYELKSKAYHFYDLVTKRLHISRDVVFHEG